MLPGWLVAQYVTVQHEKVIVTMTGEVDQPCRPSKPSVRSGALHFFHSDDFSSRIAEAENNNFCTKRATCF